jgi:hypothetical protein
LNDAVYLPYAITIDGNAADGLPLVVVYWSFFGWPDMRPTTMPGLPSRNHNWDRQVNRGGATSFPLDVVVQPVTLRVVVKAAGLGRVFKISFIIC